MKFFPEEKKKRILSVLILLVSIAGIVYFNFAAQAPSPAPSVPGITAPDAGARGGLLPYGGKIDDSILETDQFKLLRAAPRLLISPQELGKIDPFAPR